MDKHLKFGIWYSRILLLLVSILFTSIALKNLLHPFEAAKQSNITLSSATAFSVFRVSMGALPLGFAIFTFVSLFSQRQVSRGLLLVFVLVGITTLVRIASLKIDGNSDFGEKVLIPEIVITILSAVGFYLDQRRTKHKKMV